jgi:hypothetical protein
VLRHVRPTILERNSPSLPRVKSLICVSNFEQTAKTNNAISTHYLSEPVEAHPALSRRGGKQGYESSKDT